VPKAVYRSGCRDKNNRPRSDSNLRVHRQRPPFLLSAKNQLFLLFLPLSTRLRSRFPFSPLPSFLPSLSLEVGPLNPARGEGWEEGREGRATEWGGEGRQGKGGNFRAFPVPNLPQHHCKHPDDKIAHLPDKTKYHCVGSLDAGGNKFKKLIMFLIRSMYDTSTSYFKHTSVVLLK